MIKSRLYNFSIFLFPSFARSSLIIKAVFSIANQMRELNLKIEKYFLELYKCI